MPILLVVCMLNTTLVTILNFIMERYTQGYILCYLGYQKLI